MVKKIISAPVFWSCLLLILAEVIAFSIVPRQKTFVVVYNIPSPQVGVQFPLVYFFVAVVVIGLVLFFVPVSKLRLLLTVLFTLIFVWGLFIIFNLIFPISFSIYIAAPLAVLAGIAWFFKPKIWLHNILLLLALVSLGLVFGYLVSPWTAMILLLIIAVYDFLAVKFGYMMWMAEKLSESDVLPAFVIPKNIRNWNLNLKKAGFKKLFEERAEKEFSLLGGGDIGFPLLLAVSVLFIHGLAGGIIICAFSILGLAGAYAAQAFLFKGKPTPGLPTIALATLIGFLIVRFVI